MPRLSTAKALLTLLAPFLLAAVVAQNTSTSLPAATSLCTSSSSESRPNPFAANAYPGLGTGTANGTVAILPIPYTTARQVVPAEYPILQHVYKEFFPGLAEAGLYPVCSFPFFFFYFLFLKLSRERFWGRNAKIWGGEGRI